MKKGFKSFLKYVLFSGFLSVSAVASPIASPGTSTVYSGTNSSLIYSPTVTSGSGGGNGCELSLLRPVLIDQTNPGTYIRTVDLSSFANCGSDVMLVIKAAGGQGGNYGGLGGITTLKIPLSALLQEYGTQVTFYYLVNMGGGANYGGRYGGGESLVSLNNWPWNNGVPLAIGGGGGGGGFRYSDGSNGYTYYYGFDPGGGGGGGNDPGESDYSYGYNCFNSDGGGGGGGVGGSGGMIGTNCAGYSVADTAGGNGWYGIGGGGWYGGGGGAGYGGGGGGGIGYLWSNLTDWYGGAGGGGYCNTSLGTCEASDWTNGGGNHGGGYVEIYIEDGEETPINTTLP